MGKWKIYVFRKNAMVILLLLIANYAMTQSNRTYLNMLYTVKIEMDKEKYSVDEEIYIIFKVDFKHDSLKLPKFDGFKIIKGPYTNSNMSTHNGVTEQTKSITYTLKPNNTGVYIIESPTFFVNGEEIKEYKKILN